MLNWVNSYKSLFQHFSLSFHGNKSKWGICTTSLYLVEATEQTFIKKVLSKYLSEIAIKTYFHFSRYKSMETLSCNESAWAMAIKNKLFVEADVMNISEKVSASPPYGFWDDFLMFFREFIKFSGLDKIHMFGRGLIYGTFL